MNSDLAREFLHYVPKTGILIWRTRERRWFPDDGHWRTWNTRFASTVACTKNKSGHLSVLILGRRYYAHRLIWLWMTGEWPDGEIDHKNRDPSDNRWTNLRVVTHRQNTRNGPLLRSNTSGHVGIYIRKSDGAFLAQISIDGKHHHLGVFGTMDEAIRARKAAEKAFGFMPEHANSPKIRD